MKVTKIKDVGTANCDVLQESSEDSTHVKRVTPLESKAQQMKSAEELGIDPKREKSTSRKRANKETRLL